MEITVAQQEAAHLMTSYNSIAHNHIFRNASLYSKTALFGFILWSSTGICYFTSKYDPTQQYSSQQCDDDVVLLRHHQFRYLYQHTTALCIKATTQQQRTRRKNMPDHARRCEVCFGAKTGGMRFESSTAGKLYILSDSILHTRYQYVIV